MKRCCTCKENKPLSEFDKQIASKDGLQNQCRDCQQEYQQEYHKTIKGRLRFIYAAIKCRCTNPNFKQYRDYGGRGIRCLFASDEFINYMINDMGIDTIDKIKGLRVGRINNNGNYRPGNIRIVTCSQNCQNSRKQKTFCGRSCSSRFKGVCWAKTKEKWRAYICINRKCIHLGCFDSEIEAAKIYDTAAIKYHGEYACTNEVLGLYNGDD